MPRIHRLMLGENMVFSYRRRVITVALVLFASYVFVALLVPSLYVYMAGLFWATVVIASMLFATGGPKEDKIFEPAEVVIHMAKNGYEFIVNPNDLKVVGDFNVLIGKVRVGENDYTNPKTFYIPRTVSNVRLGFKGGFGYILYEVAAGSGAFVYLGRGWVQDRQPGSHFHQVDV